MLEIRFALPPPPPSYAFDGEGDVLRLSGMGDSKNPTETETDTQKMSETLGKPIPRPIFPNFFSKDQEVLTAERGRHRAGEERMAVLGRSGIPSRVLDTEKR